MSIEEDRKKIEEAFSTSWGSHTPVEYDNVKYDQDNHFVATGAKQAWVRLSVVHGEELAISVAPNARYRRFGIVVVGCFIEEGTGTGEALTLAERAAEIFRGKRFGTSGPGQLVFRQVSTVPVGPSDGWYQVNTDAAYYTDRIVDINA